MKYMVKAEAVIIGLRSPGITSDGNSSGASVGAFEASNACCARSRALVLVATESDIRRLFVGRTGGFGLAFENVCDRRSPSLTGRRN